MVLRPRDEARDLALVLVTAALVALAWVAALGWRGDLLSNHDATLYFLLLRDLVRNHGDWHAISSAPGAFGGVALTGVYGAAPSFVLGARLSGSAIATFDFAVIVTQVCFGVLGATASLDLAAVLPARQPRRDRRDRSARPLALSVPLAIAFAFLPALGFRLSYGHLNLVWGLFAFVAPLSLVAASRAGRSSMVLLLVAFLALLHTFQSHGFQTIVYAALFGWPIVLAVSAIDGRPREATAACLVPLVVALLALAISWPKLSAMLSYLLGPDATRSAGDVRGFRWILAHPRDWLSCLAWSPQLIGSGRPAQLDHETHYAFGPLLALLAIVPFRRARGLALALAWALLVPLLVSMDVPPFSTLFVKLPLVAAFRVPQRAILPFAIALPIVTFAALAAARDRAPSRRALRFLPLVIAPLLAAPLPPWVRELLGWSAAIAIVIAIRLRLPFTRVGALALLSALSIAAFGERLLPFLSADSLVHAPAKLRAEVLARAPELASPLTRASLQLSIGSFGPNTALAADLSSLDGYGYPPRRFVQLVSAAAGVPYDSLQTTVQIDPRREEARLLGRLYDVRAIVVPLPPGDPRGLLLVMKPGATAGPAWFSGRLEGVASFEALAARLRAQPALDKALHEVAWIVSDDAATAGVPTITDGCRDARVVDVQAAPGDPHVRLRVQTGARCPLTVAVNHLSTHRARANGQPLATFPIYGALTGMIVPAGATEIALQL
ncbi:MAG: hypothetical protein HYV09_39960 [Deltaproteobacteria bacterium]|nr:hypothetical protein [Deltaproteobacteria bacterium]